MYIQYTPLHYLQQQYSESSLIRAPVIQTLANLNSEIDCSIRVFVKSVCSIRVVD